MATDDYGALHEDLRRLSLLAAWLDLMITWDQERRSRRGEGRAHPRYGVRTPMHTKSHACAHPAPVPGSLALAA